MRKVVLFACLLLIISACGPTRSETATPVAPTATPTSTITPTPAPSLTPSPTLPPTITPTPSPADEAWLARITSTLRGQGKIPAGYPEFWDLRESASISPDGHWLASVIWDDDQPLNGGELVVASLLGPEQVFREHLADTRITRTAFVLAWSPDSSRFILLGSDFPVNAPCSGEVTHVVSIQATGLKSFTHQWDERACPTATWSPDGQSVLFVLSTEMNSTAIWLMDASSGAVSEKARWSLGSAVMLPLAWTENGFYYEACVNDCYTTRLMQLDTATWSTRAVKDLPGFAWAVELGAYDRNNKSVIATLRTSNESPPRTLARLSLDSQAGINSVDLPKGLLSDGAASSDPGNFAAVIVGGHLYVFDAADGTLAAHGAAYRLIGWFTNIHGFLVIAPQVQGQTSVSELRIVRP